MDLSVAQGSLGELSRPAQLVPRGPRGTYEGGLEATARSRWTRPARGTRGGARRTSGLVRHAQLSEAELPQLLLRA